MACCASLCHISSYWQPSQLSSRHGNAIVSRGPVLLIINVHNISVIMQGLDISGDMLDVASEREVEGDLCLHDLGHGLPLRPGSFDGAVSISAVQWLCNAVSQGNIEGIDAATGVSRPHVMQQSE